MATAVGSPEEMEEKLRVVERLAQATWTRLEDLRGSHDSLVHALYALRSCHEKAQALTGVAAVRAAALAAAESLPKPPDREQSLGKVAADNQEQALGDGKISSAGSSLRIGMGFSHERAVPKALSQPPPPLTENFPVAPPRLAGARDPGAATAAATAVAALAGREAAASVGSWERERTVGDGDVHRSRSDCRGPTTAGAMARADSAPAGAASRRHEMHMLPPGQGQSTTAAPIAPSLSAGTATAASSAATLAGRPSVASSSPSMGVTGARVPPASPGGFDGGTMRVVALAHERGLTLGDLEKFNDREWNQLGATTSERRTILGMLEERRRQLRGESLGGSGSQAFPSRQQSAPVTRQDGMPAGQSSAYGGRSQNCKDGMEASLTHASHGRRLGGAPRDHIRGATAVNDCPGAHGHPKDCDFQNGLPRYIGHGRQHFALKDNIESGMQTTAEAADLSRSLGHGRHHVAVKDHLGMGLTDVEEIKLGLHGHSKESAFQDGIERGIGHGRRYVGTTDHVYGGTAADDLPGAHGHLKDEDYQNGMPRGIGHGKHHIAVKDHIEGGLVIKGEIAECAPCEGTRPAGMASSHPATANGVSSTLLPQQHTRTCW
eukprot:gnl/TRDRNA2_/TRDRNA2_130956_c2_seq1.p1 gnl/TRDRNA2_/TRDRNA2_130956_c2~~gnl/TRDRNA2_/TRDRNA2_130956_c2_seq1.p1  ORF type:complete len:621 (+),score=113.52 gnl/TRDRNA2_/TRDRNA2_130956_c2_seq1:43-1863(+)